MGSQEREETITQGANGQPRSLIPLWKAARAHGVSLSGLRSAVERGDVRHQKRRPYGNGEMILFDAQKLQEDLAGYPRCRVDGCERPSLHSSGCCATHVSTSKRWRRKASPEERAVRRAEVARLATQKLTPGEIGRRLGHSRPTIVADLEALGLAWPGKGTRPITRPPREQLEHRRRTVAKHHRNGLSPGKIAELMDWSKAAIVSDLDALGLERPGKGRRPAILPPDERAQRQREAVELYRAGHTEHEIAAELGASRSQIHRDLAAQEVEKRRVGRRREYAAPTEQRCDLCGELFTPRRGGTAARFHSQECQRRAKAHAYADALASRGLLSIAAAAERLFVVPRAVQDAIDRGELQAEWVEVSGAAHGGCWGVSEQALTGFIRSRARERRPACESWLRPDSAMRRLERMGRIERLAREKGLTPDEVRQLEIARVGERARLYALRRRGRHPHPDRDERWAEHARCTLEELTRDYEQDVELGLADPADPPSQWLAFRYVASEDWRTHPQDWPRKDYPASSSDPDSLDPGSERSAANRVATAIKRLQIAHTK